MTIADIQEARQYYMREHYAEPISVTLSPHDVAMLQAELSSTMRYITFEDSGMLSFNGMTIIPNPHISNNRIIFNSAVDSPILATLLQQSISHQIQIESSEWAPGIWVGSEGSEIKITTTEGFSHYTTIQNIDYQRRILYINSAFFIWDGDVITMSNRIATPLTIIDDRESYYEGGIMSDNDRARHAAELRGILDKTPEIVVDITLEFT